MATNIELKEILVSAGRCTKVTKGGRRFSFSAIVVVGDKKGRIGYGLGKALEVMDAKAKAIKEAKKNMRKVPLKDGRTLHHDVIGVYCASKVKLRSAPAGKGIIAGGPVRAVLQVLGIHDVVAKSLGSNNPHNIVKATIDGLSKVMTPRNIAEKRKMKIADIASMRD